MCHRAASGSPAAVVVSQSWASPDDSHSCHAAAYTTVVAPGHYTPVCRDWIEPMSSGVIRSVGTSASTAPKRHSTA